jgi:hypothetical protein
MNNYIFKDYTNDKYNFLTKHFEKTNDYEKILVNRTNQILHKFNKNFSVFVISNPIKIGYARVMCIICLELFDIFEDCDLIGCLSICCKNFNYCGNCLANADVSLLKKFKDKNMCLCFESSEKKCHFVEQGSNLLNKKLKFCYECGKNVLESSHNSLMHQGNTARIIFFKKSSFVNQRRKTCSFIGIGKFENYAWTILRNKGLHDNVRPFDSKFRLE